MRKMNALLLLSVTATVFRFGELSGNALSTDHITINIPKKICPVIPVSEVKAVMDVKLGAGVSTFTLNFVDQLNNANTLTCTKGVSTWTCGPQTSFTDNETGSAGPDTINVMQSSSPADDPLRLEIDVQLNSNHLNNSCTNTQQTPVNYYKVTIVSTPASSIEAGCLESFDGRRRQGSVNIDSCTAGSLANPFSVPISTTLVPNTLCPGNPAVPDTVAGLTIDPLPIGGSVPQPSFGCFQQRPSLDAILALDKSGSMSTVDGSPGTDSRITALHKATAAFLDDWKNLFATLSPTAGDQVGLVAYDTTAVLHSALEPVTAANVATLTNDIQTTVTAAGSTSIGGGLSLATQNMATATSSRKAILLMSDGQQNTDPMVGFVGGQIVIYCNDDSHCTGPLTNCSLSLVAPHKSCPLFPSPGSSANPQIFTVTLGPSSQVDPAIQQAIASAGGGFYINSETDPTLLGPFFLQLLQNFVRFNSYETVRLISGSVAAKAAYSTDMPISTTSHDVVFSLMWPSQFGGLRIIASPPGGGPPIERESASGFISIVQPLPLAAPFDATKDWHVEVQAVNATRASTGNTVTTPFQLHVMTDDSGMKSELSVAPNDYKPGDPIRLRAKVTHFGVPVTGLGEHPGDHIAFDLLEPGQSVGDMLSDSVASATSTNPDIQNGADAKLFNALHDNPSVLKHKGHLRIQLFDDGKPEHGDEVAGDGVYSALYPAILPGHYNFLFSVERTEADSIHFSRQQLRTAYVRSIPDASNTIVAASILGRSSARVLSIVLTPRVKAGPGCAQTDLKCGRMGPGWANYFWLTTPGRPAFKPVDNLDGTYTATLPFTSATTPLVSIHFEDVLAVIGDTITADNLPVPLGPDNILVKDCCKQPGKFAANFAGGVAIPNGSSGTGATVGFDLSAGLEYIASGHLSAEGRFGYHHLPGSIHDVGIYEFSVVGRTYLGNSIWRPFIEGGVGAYKFRPGQTDFGANVGAGLLYPITPRVSLLGNYNFHIVDTPSTWTRFSSLQGGLRILF
jgi:hypothetical protein